MIEPSEFASCFIETFDKSALKIFRSWLAKKPATTKWIIAGDFALRDKSRPGDCFAFSIIPYDLFPADFAEEVRQNLPRDLKDSKTLGANAAAWLRDSRHFHMLIPMRQDRAFYSNGDMKPRDVIQESLALTVAALISAERGDEQIRRFKAAIQKTKANSFNVGLFTDLTLLALYLAIISLILCRDRKPEMISWFCDRDSMINYCDSLVWDYAINNFVGLAGLLDIDASGIIPGVAIPDSSTGKEVMWFDHYIRAADWLAGAIAAWDREANSLPGEQDKYVRVIEDVVTESDNTVILPVYLSKDGTLTITRLELTRESAGDDTPDGAVPSTS
ncbi:hypothetical protein NKH70_33885 [Mesorhizobium sp. M0991]|uniref:hypothetical protein n=1 Tax=Mesorhizobium sp. M0991 TaxID=2957043 RepID=UPI00333DCBDF